MTCNAIDYESPRWDLWSKSIGRLFFFNLKTVNEWNKNHYASVDALHLLGDLRQPLDDRRRVNFAQNGVVAGLALRLRHQVLPAGVAAEQVPLFPPVNKKKLKISFIS
jgi:hypothetical protein